MPVRVGGWQCFEEQGTTPSPLETAKVGARDHVLIGKVTAIYARARLFMHGLG
jgi:hypothetical protein